MILKNVDTQKEKCDTGYFFFLFGKATCWFGGIIHSHWHKGCKKVQLIYAMKVVMK